MNIADPCRTRDNGGWLNAESFNCRSGNSWLTWSNPQYLNPERQEEGFPTLAIPGYERESGKLRRHLSVPRPRRRAARRLCSFTAVGLVLLAGCAGLAVNPLPARQPEERVYSGELGHVATLRDGRLISVYTVGRPDSDMLTAGPAQPAYVRHSDDDGRTWSEAVARYSYAAGRGSMPMLTQMQGPLILVDRAGVVHVLALRYYKPGSLHRTGTNNPETAFGYSKLLHNLSRDGGVTWSAPAQIDFGHAFSGEILSAIQLQTGRLLAALSYETDNYIKMRQDYEHRITVVYSDDGGNSWRIGADDIGTPIGPFVGHGGAMGSIVAELRDGRLWMLIRTQTFRFYESFSSDGGLTWTRPEPTKIAAPNAPGALLKMSDGSLILCWNDLSAYPGGEVISSGRQFLHVARSDDDGRTWSRSKLIAQPLSDDPPDVHICFPFLCESGNGDLLIRYHHNIGGSRKPARILLSIDPDWIREN